jgi:nucleoside-diphosphate-sugar epimerase
MRRLRGARVLVTGVNGFLGLHLVHVLAALNTTKGYGMKVYGTSYHAPNPALAPLLRNKDFIFKKGDLIKFCHRGAALRRFLWNGARFDCVIHAAGYGQPAKFAADPLAAVDINVNITRELLRLATDDKARFAYFSSADVYGSLPKGKMADEEYAGATTTLDVRAAYREAKRMGETVSAIFKRSYNSNAVILRSLSIYGPGIGLSDSRVMANFMKMALSDGEIRLLDQGTSKKAFCYSKDAMKMIFHAIVNGKELVYNVGGEDVITIKQLADAIGAYCGVPVRLPKIISTLPFVGSDPAFLLVDTSRVRADMKPFDWTPFQAGIARMVEWNKKAPLDAGRRR